MLILCVCALAKVIFRASSFILNSVFNARRVQVAFVIFYNTLYMFQANAVSVEIFKPLDKYTYHRRKQKMQDINLIIDCYNYGRCSNVVIISLP